MNLQAMSGAPMREMSAKTSPNHRDIPKKDSAGSESNFEQILSQKVNSRPAKKPQNLTTMESAINDDDSQIEIDESFKESNKPVSKGETKKDLKPTADDKKERTIKKFMDSFEGEFQVPPTRLVEVISQLTPEQLLDSAEQTADLVIGQLDLDPAVEPKAKKQYFDLIQDLNEISVANQQPSMGPSLGLTAIGLTQERFEKVKSQRDALQKSIDRMNQNFWQPRGFSQPLLDKNSTKVSGLASENYLSRLSSYQNGTAPGDYEFLSENQIRKSSESAPLAPSDFSGVSNQDQQGLYGTMDLQNENPELMSVLGLGAINENKEPQQISNLMTPQSRPLKTANKLDADFQQNLTPGKSVGAESLSFTKGIDRLEPFSNRTGYSDLPQAIPKVDEAKFSLANQNEGQAGNSFFGDSASAKAMAKTQKDTRSKGEDIKTLFTAHLANGNAMEDTKKVDVATSVPLPKGFSSNETDKNIQTVMNQAQYLVKKGGGEVKVKMTPEGLGQIQLKVELVDGKVQMQMVTDNKETKKILESSMSDLKDHLTSHKLSVDSIKIDTIQGVSSEVATRNQTSSDSSQNSSDRQTKQFWNQFQDQFGRGTPREALFEPPKVMGYAQKQTPSLEPAESRSSAKTNSSGKGKGLNLVA